MSFEDKLRVLCERARSAASKDFYRATQVVGRFTEEVAKSGKWDRLPVKTLDEFNDTADHAKFAVEVLDAVEYIDKRLLSASNGRLHDLKISGRSLSEIQREIFYLFNSKEAPKRGFVYIAWTHKPEWYNYVGKASKVKRLNLTAHGKLAHAVATATNLSLLFPAQSEDSILAGLEASIIRVIEHQTGSLPELNVRPERVPFGSASDKFSRFADFFARLADSLDPYETKQMS